MNSTLIAPETECQLKQAASSDDRVRDRVWNLLATMNPQDYRLERRRDARYPYPYLVRLAPVGARGERQASEPVVVVGRHLSEHGITFFHPKPLAFRRVVATLETANGMRMAFLLDLTWCRFTRHGWYESGGRFVDTVALSPDGADLRGTR